MALVRRLKAAGIRVKLYFMLGLPTETEDDMKGIAHLAQKIAETYYEVVPERTEEGQSTDRQHLLLLYRNRLHHSSGHRCIQSRILWKKPKWLRVRSVHS